MNANHTFILGGARSGKSRFAEQLAQQSNKSVIYLATAQAHDTEMQDRIVHHQQQRPVDWPLVEEPIALAEALQTHSSKDNCILVDCLTLWLSNCLCHATSDCWDEQKSALLKTLENLPGQVIFVSNEVGHGIVPLGELSRRFVDESGWLHQAIAAKAARVEFIMAGLALTLKGQS
ncbi:MULTISPECIES: bifunctional adenosylcobinamide kinase/adenosylcobinamide-phosphate guanylyltransferase [Pseudoalteromonas]|uniref:Bifunctional adenosylcobalamin biosynthesis protein n=1 Tax=Pseudoalteromonas rhizosphaerae TaxID=2518973 RepID=A0ABW8L3R4_9GAMM|nr:MULTISPECIES: bifunctional adenosylcobinamide kinase/adenosylcobinamide-phosphate guanylyltransferase [unclassified Pseudoalteromonas]MBB1335657.1 bifunctional adenosylcobinamide kinase/adenosylcobinamide-phosphate guanylyltransferase [Pseudoalteromonas sp. SR41-6]MBB1343787.1 bifunctional adenosylcobinamide kinase/adenosylcobinamide-phosphate guanylyltransferase [Pseudoalteromonas sp. SR45-6]MBB1461199.1 bifunctional adenosylcobinamide kinase/adenosylcobinamide-phosphate guanylyltransferase 